MIHSITMQEREGRPRLNRDFHPDHHIRWGVWGPGAISHKFADALDVVHDGYVLAIGSRHLDHAQAWASQHHAPRAYGSLADLAADNDVDIVYVASPMSAHYEDCKRLLEAGRSVLCEKAVTLNLEQLLDLLRIAEANGCFFMEAMWTRFLPTVQEAVRVLNDGMIGELRIVRASFNMETPFNPESRLFDPRLGGGALLDVGIYPLAMALIFMGDRVQKIHTEAVIGPTGVDHNHDILLSYADGYAALAAGVSQPEPIVCDVIGTRGRLHLHDPFNGCEEIRAYNEYGHEIHHFHWGHERNGFEFEIRAVHHALKQGQIWHDDWSWQHSIASMAIMDSCRREWEMSFPGEKADALGNYLEIPQI